MKLLQPRRSRLPVAALLLLAHCLCAPAQTVQPHELFKLLARHDIRVFVFGLTDAADGDAFNQVKGGRTSSRELLKRLAHDTGGCAVFPKKPSEFAAAAAALNRELQMPAYVLGYNPEKTVDTGKPLPVKLTLAPSTLSSRGKLRLEGGFQP